MKENRPNARRIQVAVLTISDRSSKGEREDLSGKVIEEIVRSNGWEVAYYGVVPDDKDTIRTELIKMEAQLKVDLVLTTGGTGLAPRDFTPEATLEVIDREVPGLAEAMRMESLKKTPHAMLSRAVCGARGKTLIVNLPGSPRAVRECLEVIAPAIPHAQELMQGGVSDCATEREAGSLQRRGKNSYCKPARKPTGCKGMPGGDCASNSPCPGTDAGRCFRLRHRKRGRFPAETQGYGPGLYRKRQGKNNGGAGPGPAGSRAWPPRLYAPV